MRLFPSTLALLFVAAAGAGCVRSPPGPAVCGPSAPCAAEGATCTLGRCRTKKDPLLALGDAKRLVLAPDEIALVSAKGPSGGGAGLPEAVSFGREATGSATLLLHFGVPIKDKAEVKAAFLVLEPLPGATPPASPVSIELARIVEPWQADFVSWGRQPGLALPERGSVVGATALGPLRLDVTHIVRAWAERRPEDRGLAVVAEPGDAYGATYSLGVSSGRAPRLEVYVR